MKDIYNLFLFNFALQSKFWNSVLQKFMGRFDLFTLCGQYGDQNICFVPNDSETSENSLIAFEFTTIIIPAILKINFFDICIYYNICSFVRDEYAKNLSCKYTKYYQSILIIN